MASDLTVEYCEHLRRKDQECDYCEVVALRARLAEAERLLRAMKTRDHGACQWCGGYVDNIPGKCDADCALARWLEGGGR